MAAQQGNHGWWPVGKDDFNGWRLDIVSLLAVIGESSMVDHSQAMTASWIGCLPRIIPAPQVLLKSTRPTRMPHSNASVVGVKNGILVQTLNYFPNILHPIDDLPPYAFRVYHIRHSQYAVKAQNTPWTWRTANSRHNAELPHQQRGIDEENASEPQPKLPPHVPPKTMSPLNILSIFSFVLTWAIFGLSLYDHDVIACLALVSISLVSMIVGYASFWSPELMRRTSGTTVPDGDVVIRTREGAFIVVKCDENVARELYSGTEECKYMVHNVRVYRALIGVATFLLMVSVVLLGNCNFNQQAAIGSAYILLNGLYWAASLVPKSKFWDMKLYDLKDITPKECLNADKAQLNPREPDDFPSFTRTMWYAIRVTQDVGWVRMSNTAPNTSKWNKWLKVAQEQAKEKPGGEPWKAVAAKDYMVGRTEATDEAQPESASIDGIEVRGAQRVPASEVPIDEMK